MGDEPERLTVESKGVTRPHGPSGRSPVVSGQAEETEGSSEIKMKSIDLGTSKLAAVVVLVVVAVGVGTFVLKRGGHDEQWQQHEESSFSLEAPRSWSIAETAGRITIEGESSETVVIWPFFVPGELIEESAQFVGLRLASKAVPGVTWTASRIGRARLRRLPRAA
jgi:hypothetical protein